MYRDHTKVVKIGDRVIGGGNPILIQSMTNTKTEDVAATSFGNPYEYAMVDEIDYPGFGYDCTADLLSLIHI